MRSICETLRDQHQQLMRTIAQRDAFRAHAQVRRKRSLQCEATRIGIAVALVQRPAHCIQRSRAWAERIFVRPELGNLRAEALAQRRQVMAGIVIAQTRGGGIGQVRGVELAHGGTAQLAAITRTERIPSIAVMLALSESGTAASTSIRL